MNSTTIKNSNAVVGKTDKVLEGIRQKDKNIAIIGSGASAAQVIPVTRITT